MDPIRRVPIVQQVEERIREMIDEKAFAPGEKLPAEMELCQQLCVGRGTVREAFRLLQAKGIVEIKPGRGAFVAEEALTGVDAINWLVENEKELRDSLEIRAALEPMAARRMADRCDGDALRRLESIHREFLQAIEDGDPVKIGRLDEQFHSAIVENCGNALMSEINRNVCHGMHTFRHYTFRVEQNVRNAVMPHSNIVNAILARDADQAEREMRAHLDKVQEDLTQNIHLPSGD
jgi:GntR family transcriptional repressor for pyruvate dehydrogenase complex